MTAKKDQAPAGDVGDVTESEEAFGRRAARAELATARAEDERRESLGLAEIDNYARAHGEPIVKEQ